MSNISIGGTLVPLGTDPIVRDTDAYAGFRVVATIAVRDAILASMAEVGMKVFVQADSTTYRLQSIGPYVWVVDAATTAAAWTLGSFRWYALDYDGGNDANAGYSDVSPAAAGLVALKTWQGLLAILPANGAGRSVEIVIKARAAGATYLRQDGVTAADLDLRPLLNYGRLSIRGTATEPTANAVAFAGDAADQIFCGAQIATGWNAAGYKCTKGTATITGYTQATPIVIAHNAGLVFTAGEAIAITGTDDGGGDAGVNLLVGIVGTVVDANHFELKGPGTAANNGTTDGTTYPAWVSGGTITRYKVTKADATAPALGTEASASLGLRGLRLRGNATALNIAASRNFTTAILGFSSDTIIPSGAATFAPNANDIWYLEEPGVAFANVFVGGINGVDPLNITAVPQQCQIFGLRTTSGSSQEFSIVSATQDIRIGFVHAAGAVFARNCGASLTSSPTYVDSGAVNRAVGGSLRAGQIAASNCSNVQWSFAYALSGFSFNGVPTYRMASCVSMNAVAITRSGTSSTSISPSGLVNMTDCRIRNVTGVNSHGFLQLTQVDQVGIVAAVFLQTNRSSWILDRMYDCRVVASGGSITLQAGLAISGIDNSIMYFGRRVFFKGITGTTSSPGKQKAEIVMGQPGFATYQYAWLSTDLVMTDIKDPAGNRVYVSSNATALNVVDAGKELITVDNPSFFENDDAADIPRFSLIHVTALLNVRSSGLMRANTLANVKGQILVAGNTTFRVNGTTQSTAIAAHSSGLIWVISDDAPTVGEPVYVSTTAGRVQAAAPTSGQYQRIVGLVARTKVVNAINYALVGLNPELVAVLVP